MNGGQASERTSLFLTQGRVLGERLGEYVEKMEYEFRHEKLPVQLQAVAQRGLKVATGLDIEGWRGFQRRWLAAIEGAQQGDPSILLENAEAWKGRLRKYLKFLQMAPMESRRFFGDENTQTEVQSLFAVEGAGLVSEQVEWLGQIPCLLEVEDREDGRSLSLHKNEMAVSASELTKSYGDVRALNGVSLQVPRGEVFGMLGPNGAGKTTLIECLEGIRTPDSGQIEVLGQPYTGRNTIRERIGIQLQATGLYPTLTVKETLRLYASFFKHSRPIGEVLGRVGLDAKASSQVKNLSGGQHQRLSLAIALVNDPDVLFLDEPTMGLDPQVRHGLWDMIRDLRDGGKTVFLTTHYMDEAEQLCDRVAIIDAGRIIELGSPRELIAKHVGQRSIDVTFDGPTDGSYLAKLPAVVNYRAHEDRAVLTSSDEKATLVALLGGGVARVRGLAVRQGSLEDVFLMLTNKGID